MSGGEETGSLEHQGHLAALSGLAEECQKQPDALYRLLTVRKGDSGKLK